MEEIETIVITEEEYKKLKRSYLILRAIEQVSIAHDEYKKEISSQNNSNHHSKNVEINSKGVADGFSLCRGLLNEYIIKF